MARSCGMGYTPHGSLDQMARLFQKAEQEWGYDTIWLPDERFHYDVYAILALAAAHTKQVRLGTAVTDPYSRHPAQTARGIGTIDTLSNGRAILGIGAGVSGLREMGIAREQPIPRIRESVELCRALWQGGIVDYHGEHVQFNTGHLEFAARPGIPVWVATRAPQMIQLAGEVADGVLFGSLSSPLALRYGLRRLQKGAEKAGRALGEIRKGAWLQTFIHTDGQLARESARWMAAFQIRSSRPFLAEMGLDVPASVLDKLVWQNYHLSPENLSEAGRHVPDEFMPHLTVAGDPDMVGRQVEQLFEAGLDHVGILAWQVGDQTPEQGLELFARQVMPHL